MASPRPTWRGHLRLALVSCPIALYSVVRGTSGLHFHLINPKTGHRVRMVSQDAETDEEVSRQDLVKGFEFEKDRYVILDEDDFEQARIDSSSTLTIGKFVDVTTIEPIYFDTSYYLAPDGDAGQDVFVVLREAIRKSRAAALARVVLARRERAVAIIPSGKGLICHTLHEPSDLWEAGPLFQDIEEIRPDAEMVTLASNLIKRQYGKFQPDDTTDRYEAKLHDVIEAKLRGEGITPEQPPDTGSSNVIDLMAALKASLAPSKQPAAAKKPAPAKQRTRRRAS